MALPLEMDPAASAASPDDPAVAAPPPGLELSPFAATGAAVMDEDFSEGEGPVPGGEESPDPLDAEVDGLDMTLEEAILGEQVPMPPLIGAQETGALPERVAPSFRKLGNGRWLYIATS